jgi:sugar phosphate isomerase/epimerase
MLTPVFSTVACPEWTLQTVFESAARMGWMGVELRTFGPGSREFACDPALTAPEKVRAWADRLGVPVRVLATSCRFDQPITPPVVGLVLGDPDRPVREVKSSIDLAATIECPLVRVFAFEPPSAERGESSMARIVDRLRKAVDAAHHTGVRLVLENGGAFPRAADLLPIIDAVKSPLLGVAYNVAVGAAAGDEPAGAVRLLGPRLLAARLKDVDGDGRPCALGSGRVPCKALVEALIDTSFAGPLVYEWERAWIPGLAPAEPTLAAAVRTIFGWLGTHAPAGGQRAVTSVRS